MWVDTHCHLQMDERDSSEIVARAREAGVSPMICVGTNLEYSRLAIATAAEFDDVWATIGLHPHEATDGLDGLEELIASPKVVGIGECGLDFFYDNSPREEQKAVFAQQVKWANQYDKTLVVHTRDAWDATIEVIKDSGVPERLVIHCFTGGPDEALRCLALGAYISISGIVTFKNAQSIRDALQVIPLDRLLVETDAPWLAPVPNRGKENEPAWVKHVGEFVAGEMKIDIGECERATFANAHSVFANIS